MIEFLQHPEYLSITNVVLSVCIVFHLACEFFHYIYSFLTSRKDSKKINSNNELLFELNERVKYLEGVHKSCEKINCDHDNG